MLQIWSLGSLLFETHLVHGDLQFLFCSTALKVFYRHPMLRAKMMWIKWSKHRSLAYLAVPWPLVCRVLLAKQQGQTPASWHTDMSLGSTQSQQHFGGMFRSLKLNLCWPLWSVFPQQYHASYISKLLDVIWCYLMLLEVDVAFEYAELLNCYLPVWRVVFSQGEAGDGLPGTPHRWSRAILFGPWINAGKLWHELSNAFFVETCWK